MITSARAQKPMSCLVRRAVLNLRSNFTGNGHLWTSGSNATGLYGFHRLKFPQEKPVSCLFRRAVLNLRLNFTGTRHLSTSGSDAAGLYGFHRLKSPQGFQRLIDDAIKRYTNYPHCISVIALEITCP